MCLCFVFSVCDCKEYREKLAQHVPGTTPAAGAAPRGSLWSAA